MENDLNFFKMEGNLKLFKMEDNLNFLEKEDNPNFGKIFPPSTKLQAQPSYRRA